MNEAEQMMQFLEVVLIEVREESRRSDGMRRDVEIVNVPVPVLSNGGSGRSDGW
jgi:hypothetical protein